jgi:hypothetical protein
MGATSSTKTSAVPAPCFIVNQSFARQHLNEAAAGQHVRGWMRKGPGSWEIIAIVEDVRRDALTFCVVPMVILTVAAAACVSPARRACRIDPLRALKSSP